MATSSSPSSRSRRCRGVSAYARGGNPPELIKAFHWHRKQWDYWDIVQGNARVVLVDLHPTHPPAAVIQMVVLG